MYICTRFEIILGKLSLHIHLSLSTFIRTIDFSARFIGFLPLSIFCISPLKDCVFINYRCMCLSVQKKRKKKKMREHGILDSSKPIAQERISTRVAHSRLFQRNLSSVNYSVSTTSCRATSQSASFSTRASMIAIVKSTR